jgi:hypothetical protein
MDEIRLDRFCISSLFRFSVLSRSLTIIATEIASMNIDTKVLLHYTNIFILNINGRAFPKDWLYVLQFVRF